MPKKLTKRKLKAFMADEAAAHKEYKAYGLPNLSKDEGRHHKFLQGLLTHLDKATKAGK